MAYSTSGSLTCSTLNESNITMILSGLPKKVGYPRTIKWYYKRSVDDSWVLFDTTTISGTSSTNSFTKIKSSLYPDTVYSFRARIYTGSTLITTKSDTATTDEMTGTLSRIVYSNSITFQITGLYQSTGFDRTMRVEYKQHSSIEWSNATTYGGDIPEGNKKGLIKVLLLSPNTAYDFRIKFYAGSIYLGKREAMNVTTPRLTSSIPDVILSEVRHIYFTNIIRVFWDCPDAGVGTSFKICYTPEGGAEVEGTSITAVPEIGYTDVEIEGITENTNFEFTIKSYLSGATGNKETDPIEVTMYIEFDWDDAKVQGEEFVLTASEWNRMIDFLAAKFPENYEDVTNPTGGYGAPGYRMSLRTFPGRLVNDTDFNAVLAIAEIEGHDVVEGDPIKASDLNLIKDTLNG